MTYQSPIEVFQTQLQNQLEGEIYNAVMRVGVNADKDELLKALRHDRDQYQKGYADRDSEIVRCKECGHIQRDGWCKYYRHSGTEDWFCADGVKRE